MKKLIYFDFVGTYGGAQQSTSTLLNFISKEYSINATVYYVNNTNKLFLDSLLINKEKIDFSFFSNFDIFKIRKKYIQAFIYLLICFVFLIVKNNNNSIFMCNSPKALLLLCLLKFFKKIEVHYYCRGWGVMDSFHPFIRFLLNKVVDKVYVVSESTSVNLSKFICLKKIFVTYTSVDLESIKLKKNEKLNIWFPKDKIKIVFAGAIIKTKGLHTLLESINLLPEKMQKKYIIYIAGNFDKNDDYYNYCNNIISTSSCKVLWLGWVNNVPSLIYNSDIVCLPSYTEGLPRIIQEGMYLSKLCIATPVGGIQDLIQHNKTGLLFNVEDYEYLSFLFSEIYSGGINIENLGVEAKKLIESKYTLKLQAQLFVNALLSDI